MTAEVLGSKLKTSTLKQAFLHRPTEARRAPLEGRVWCRCLQLKALWSSSTSLLLCWQSVFRNPSVFAEGRRCKGLKIWRAESRMAEVLQKFLLCYFNLEKDTGIPTENKLYRRRTHFINIHIGRPSAITVPYLLAPGGAALRREPGHQRPPGTCFNLTQPFLGTFQMKVTPAPHSTLSPAEMAF